MTSKDAPQNNTQLNGEFLAANNPQGERPLLVFVHGFLGSTDDWSSVVAEFTDYPRLLLDLPGHGKSVHVPCAGFDEACAAIDTTIQETLLAQRFSDTYPICLVGYSLGARLLMYFLTEYQHRKTGADNRALIAHQIANSSVTDSVITNSAITNGVLTNNPIIGLVIEGGNFGIADLSQRKIRLQADQVWASRFKNENIVDVLVDWYQQPVFSSLNHEQRQLLIAKRSVNLGGKLSEMMDATSLGRQPYLLDSVQQLHFSSGRQALFISGEQDKKFTALAQSSDIEHCIIEQAGHNVHKEHPKAFAAALLEYLNTPY
ncbi:alpha/beta fold hydrolase [Vibrio sp. E150_011]